MSISLKDVIGVKYAERNYVVRQEINAGLCVGACLFSGPTHGPAPAKILRLEQ
jgi:hypothetical protein